MNHMLMLVLGSAPSSAPTVTSVAPSPAATFCVPLCSQEGRDPCVCVLLPFLHPIAPPTHSHPTTPHQGPRTPRGGDTPPTPTSGPKRRNLSIAAGGDDGALGLLLGADRRRASLSGGSVVAVLQLINKSDGVPPPRQTATPLCTTLYLHCSSPPPMSAFWKRQPPKLASYSTRNRWSCLCSAGRSFQSPLSLSPLVWLWCGLGMSGRGRRGWMFGRS